MTLEQLIAKITEAGYRYNGVNPYTMIGRRRDGFGILTPNMNVLAAPVVLIPSEPPVEKDCVFITNLLEDTRDIRGYARVEMGVTLEGGVITHLQFIKG